MSAIRELEQKREYVLPPHTKAYGKVTAYIEGYPTEDDEPMSATEFHGRQISTLSTMLISFFGVDQQVYVGTDSFIYYQEGIFPKVLRQMYTLSVELIPFPLGGVSILGQKVLCPLLPLNSSRKVRKRETARTSQNCICKRSA